MAFLQSRSISLVDMYIDNSEPSENVGQIHFSLEYDFQNTTLILKIMQVTYIKWDIYERFFFRFPLFYYSSFLLKQNPPARARKKKQLNYSIKKTKTESYLCRNSFVSIKLFCPIKPTDNIAFCWIKSNWIFTCFFFCYRRSLNMKLFDF